MAMPLSTSTWLDRSPIFQNRDMFVNIPLITDWHLNLITTNREHFVNEQLWRSNTRRQRYYTPGLRVLKNLHKPTNTNTKLGKRMSGPYNITQSPCERNNHHTTQARSN
eukprot:scaffold10097_cov67-Skeletonema_dohrnii-CCMP3373.AAC.1